ncbi:AMP-binding protein [Paraburkholderia phenoliruptrix]|uniref:AMP-binding protein n=1 Tax=Paraburkholderia phenoliruptrix TaxID=252970 RepID=UPI0001C01E49|nr:AMP-binding protein [Paraburkholderia phenoliruptrix]MDR6421055.1 acyl-CoA synthetase (AMP-forming)/AMP-acid ligase II [Paraburkholderia phenoliruptrix]
MNSGFVSRQHPERAALIAESGVTLTYAELHQAVDRLAAVLPQRQLLFIVGTNDLPTLLCYLASLARGAVPLLLSNGLDPVQLNRLIETYDPAYLFAAKGAGHAHALGTPVHEEGTYGLYQRVNAKRVELHPDLALLMTTSGSTGSPKLVRLTAANLRANAASIVEYLGITADERAITSLPFNYSYGLSVINSHLLAGASLVVSDRSLMDAGFWRQLNEHQATSFAGVPYSYDMLLKLRLARINMPSVRTLTQAGGRLDPAKLRQVSEICRAKGIRFFSMYGQTEATARIAYLKPEEIEHKAGSIGRAIPGGRLWLESDDGRTIARPGEVGELVYAGGNVSMGYAQKASDLALGDANGGMLRTGDLARVDEDGCFFVEGRRHRFLKILGLRISLDAVEQVAADKGFSCAAKGSDEQLVIHVVDSPDLVADDFKNAMAKSLGLHPSVVVVNRLPELPRLPTGKVDYQCLTQLS